MFSYSFSSPDHISKKKQPETATNQPNPTTVDRTVGTKIQR